MTLIVASVHGRPPSQVHGADMIEIRADDVELAQVDTLIPTFLETTSQPTIFTVRSVEEGGNFQGDDMHRIALLKAALTCSRPPKYIDIEYEILTKQPWLLDELPLKDCGVILSWHDTRGRPKDLFQRAAAMQDIAGISVVKMVWRARSIRDNLDAFELLRTRQQPMIALCMGAYGLMSRVLAPKFGGFATFATIEGHEATADGQPTVHDLLTTYNFDTIDQETKVFGVIGENVEHSASPPFHNAAFAAADANAVYVPLPIPRGWEHLKATTLSLLHNESLDFCGASVTIPHKENMLKLVEEESGKIAASSQNIGAVNTIHTNTIMRATNTDVDAIESLLQTPKRVLVLGAGGVARAAVYGAKQLGAKVVIIARRAQQAEVLANEFDCLLGLDECENVDTIINCTPVGMLDGPDVDGDPLINLAPEVVLRSEMTVFDTVYMPEETPLLVRAKKASCHVISGGEMFRKQAASQQLFWTKNSF